MNPEHPSESLLERSLAAWDVPEPAHDLTDRILAHNADAVEALARPASTPSFARTDETPTMLPTEPRPSSNLRPFLTATVLGFAAAAALLLAFSAGRETARPAPLTPATPKVEINVAAPVAAPAPPTPPPAPAAPERLIIEETTPGLPQAPSLAPDSPEENAAPHPPRPPKKSLKDPFVDGEGEDETPISGDLLNPFR